MDSQSYKFIEGVLGTDGAQALSKAADRSPVLENAMLPRTIIAWLGITTRGDYEGELPGVPDTYVSFKKSDNSYSGTISIGESNHNFLDANVFHLAAAVAVALGADGEHVDPALKNIDLVKLGKSIDLLAKAKVVVKELKQRKAEAPGPAAEPTSQGAPQAATAPMKQPKQPMPPKAAAGVGKQQKLPKVPAAKLPSLKMSEDSMGKKCGMCGGVQFRGEQFIGCLCFRDLAKSTKTHREGEQIVFEFGREWDRESLSVFIHTVNSEKK